MSVVSGANRRLAIARRRFLFRLFFSGPDSLMSGDTGSLPTLSSTTRPHAATTESAYIPKG
jgi:hypothetical protein